MSLPRIVSLRIPGCRSPHLLHHHPHPPWRRCHDIHHQEIYFQGKRLDNDFSSLEAVGLEHEAWTEKGHVRIINSYNLQPSNHQCNHINIHRIFIGSFSSYMFILILLKRFNAILSPTNRQLTRRSWTCAAARAPAAPSVTSPQRRGKGVTRQGNSCGFVDFHAETCAF